MTAMNSMFDEQRPSREREIFLEALDWPARPERQTYLDAACAGDKALRHQMEAMLYMAEQEEPVRRRVAFKVIKLGMDIREVVGRFLLGLICTPPRFGVWNFGTGRLVVSLAHSNSVRLVDWSPDGHWLAAPCACSKWNERRNIESCSRTP
jgi:hypothetical protein